MSLLALWGALALFLIVVMSCAWVAQRLTAQGGWADAFWSIGVGAAGAIGALAPLAGPPTPRAWIVALLALAWGLRLGLHVATRAASGGEDPRYADLRRQWGDRFQLKMFGFLMLQALAGTLLAGSMLVAARNPAPGLGLQDALAVLVLVLAVAGEGLADHQLRRCKSDPKVTSGVCDRGLWAWSRHPNYFFEWLGWCAYPIFAISTAWPWGWLALSGPAYMYWLLRYVSGVPPLEAHMLRTRKTAFEAYAARVSVFFPLPPRKQP